MTGKELYEAYRCRHSYPDCITRWDLLTDSYQGIWNSMAAAVNQKAGGGGGNWTGEKLYEYYEERSNAFNSPDEVCLSDWGQLPSWCKFAFDSMARLIPPGTEDEAEKSKLAVAQDKLASLQAVTLTLKSYVESLMEVAARNLPPPDHEGSCGPESGCDGVCVERAELGSLFSSCRIALKQTQEHLDMKEQSAEKFKP